MAGKAPGRIQLLFVLLFFLAISGALGAEEAAGIAFHEYEMRFDIRPDGRVAETLRLGLANATSGEVLFPIAVGGGTSLGARNSSAPLEVEETPEGGKRVLLPRGSAELVLTFTADDLVFARDQESVFTTVLHPPAGTERLRIEVLLPEGRILTREALSPPDPARSTDGRRTLLRWSLAAGGPVAVVVPFGLPSSPASLWPLVGAGGLAAAAGMGGAVLYYRGSAARSRFEGYTEDQQRAIALLRTRGTLNQDDLREALGFSKAKATRVVQALEAKGLLEKERWGRTNRLRWRGD